MNNKSHLTAIRRNKLSAPMKVINELENGIYGYPSLDYGCGRGEDAEILGMAKYDPFYFPNKNLLEYIGFYKIITCNFVLNVVDEAEGKIIVGHIYNLLSNEGRAYITVRRDVKQDGFTKRGTFQRNVVLNLQSIHKNSGFEIYLLTKQSNFGKIFAI